MAPHVADILLRNSSLVPLRELIDLLWKQEDFDKSSFVQHVLDGINRNQNRQEVMSTCFRDYSGSRFLNYPETLAIFLQDTYRPMLDEFLQEAMPGTALSLLNNELITPRERMILAAGLKKNWSERTREQADKVLRELSEGEEVKAEDKPASAKSPVPAMKAM